MLMFYLLLITSTSMLHCAGLSALFISYGIPIDSTDSDSVLKCATTCLTHRNNATFFCRGFIINETYGCILTNQASSIDSQYGQYILWDFDGFEGNCSEMINESIASPLDQLLSVPYLFTTFYLNNSRIEVYDHNEISSSCEERCKTRNLTMISIHSQEENDALYNIASQLTPSGLRLAHLGMYMNNTGYNNDSAQDPCPPRENYYWWTDGSPTDFKNWDLTNNGLINPSFGDEGCANNNVVRIVMETVALRKSHPKVYHHCLVPSQASDLQMQTFYLLLITSTSMLNCVGSSALFLGYGIPTDSTDSDSVMDCAVTCLTHSNNATFFCRGFIMNGTDGCILTDQASFIDSQYGQYILWDFDGFEGNCPAMINESITSPLDELLSVPYLLTTFYLNGSRVEVYDHNENYTTCEERCKARNLTMISIHSQEENDALYNIANQLTPSGTRLAHLGMYLDNAGFAAASADNPPRENYYWWKDGSPTDFKNWDLTNGAVNPSFGTEGCVYLTTETTGNPGLWNDVICDNKRLGNCICKDSYEKNEEMNA